ncbi:hypothetical protein BDF20DRAFT_995811 [Mycotypha africana]|uniref:uncharacterized protein n=1 Tax=Mycotypha africana TaxID=64632 RepID=UPI002300E695|nr:uncharacterized protein BDF20DRAFT_995811 [Mycotypha africana]KAI8970020.1 hypothetical protein BDF20DRAFT_995811 [Mycotypha africana]
MTGVTSLPADEGGDVSVNPVQKQLRKARQWFAHNLGVGGVRSEAEPLLPLEERALADKNRKQRIGKLAAASTVILALFALGAGIGIWHYCSEHKHDPIDNVPESPSPAFPSLTDQEKFALNFPSNDSIRDYLKIYTSESHLAGTANDKKQALWTRDQFESFGLKTQIETYWPLLNYPISRRLALVSGPKHLQFEAKLTEDPVDDDETSKNPNEVPLFHGYSKNGTVKGRVVYANYGRVEDFQYLKDQGIELKGTIALVRYGGAFRGLKVRAAELFGCAGALIYSDPIDDGPLNKDNSSNPAKSYPDGPWRSKSSAQRGSVQYFSLIAGDPLTPGYPATENATRIRPEDSKGLAKIPSLPLSWEDALPLLKATQGLGVRGKKEEWVGGLTEVDYYSGPTEGEAILVNHIENKITPIWNVIACIEGKEEPEKAIVLGNHRDAWSYGAVDPSSGSAAFLELAKMFGKLLDTGWQPRRTIILASWDAEEYGLVGSTEWVEDHKERLGKEGVVYINVDTGVSGSHFRAQASPSLNQLLYFVTAHIEDPRTGKSVFDAWKLDNKVSNGGNPPVYLLGSGSDFVPFLDHIGIASINLAFVGDYGVYHSNYDSFRWMEKFGDPQFLYHEALVKLWGLLTLQLADPPLLPLYPKDYATELQKYTDSLTASAAPHSFPQLQNAIKMLEKATRRFERRRQRLQDRLSEYASLEDIPEVLLKRLEKVNNCLTYFERSFIDAAGIKGREWFKHVVYAPGLWTGYQSQIFPAIYDSINDNDFEEALLAETRAAEAIQNASERLKAA